MMPINIIKKAFDEIEINLADDLIELEQLLLQFDNDTRQGVKEIVRRNKKRIDDFHLEIKRVQKLNEFELSYFDLGYEYIAGVDEVGRGPLAGPVVCACVVFPRDTIIMGIDDSKKLTASKREKLVSEITEKAISIGIAEVSPKVIDEININEAIFSAMKMSIDKLSIVPNIVLVDGNLEIKNIELKQRTIVKGDSKSISIAAASIIAKVYRDKIMLDYYETYKEYNFKSNKGYGSSEHIEAIKKFGACEIHRKSFLHNIL